MRTVAVILKPDILERGLEKEVMSTIEQNIGKILFKHKSKLDNETISEMYSEHIGEYYYVDGIENILGRGETIQMLVDTDKSFSELVELKDNIRKLYGVDKSNNSIHITSNEKDRIREVLCINKFNVYEYVYT